MDGLGYGLGQRNRPLSVLHRILQAVPSAKVGYLDFFLLLVVDSIEQAIDFADNYFSIRMSWWRLVLVIPEILVASTVSLVAENLAVILMWFGDWYSFYIVQKEVEGMDIMHPADDDENKALMHSDQVHLV